MISGLVVRSIRGEPTKLLLEKGTIAAYRGTTFCEVVRSMHFDIQKLNGGSLKPLTWYHLFLDWNDGIKLVVSTDPKWQSPAGSDFKHINSIHTTTKRTVRKFTAYGDAFTWPKAVKRVGISSEGFIDKRLDAQWAGEDQNTGLDTGRLTPPKEMHVCGDNISEILFGGTGRRPDPPVAEAIADVVEWAKRHGCTETSETEIVSWAAKRHCSAHTEECGWCHATWNVLCNPCRARKLVDGEVGHV